jgi:hypothetical protein
MMTPFMGKLGHFLLMAVEGTKVVLQTDDLRVPLYASIRN